jgi:hypothetical protein
MENRVKLVQLVKLELVVKLVLREQKAQKV